MLGSSRRLLLRRGAVVGALIFGVLAAPARVGAVCAPPVVPAVALQAAPNVFVGTVTATADDGYDATFHVEEIWKGTNVADPIDVNGGSATREDSRSWQVGTRYLVFPSIDTAGNLLDSACSPTSVYLPAFDALRPANAHAPQGPPTSGIPGDAPIAGIFLVILVFGSIGGFFLYRTRPGPARSG